MGRFPPLVSALCAMLAAACGGAHAQAPSSGGPAVARRSSASQREQLSVTLYDDLGLVRDVRSVDLARGTVALEIEDVTARVRPETVSVQSLSSPGALAVLEQNYRSDLLTPKKLLDAYVGKRVTLHRYDEQRAAEQDLDAEVVAAGSAPVFALGGEITYDFKGRVSFPEVPASLLARPTLSVLTASGNDRQRLDVSYLTGGMAWSCAYVLVVDDAGKRGDLTAWATLDNHSGATFENAEVKLVAADALIPLSFDGEGADWTDQAVRLRDLAARVDALKAALRRAAGHRSRPFDAPVYALGEPITLPDGERKQVSLFAASGIAVDKELAFVDGNLDARNAHPGVRGSRRAGVYLTFENAEQRGLGQPLPAGVLRVYESDPDGAQQLVGESRIASTPRDERVRVKVGEAFDVVADRKQTSLVWLGQCESESDWEVVLGNHKDTGVTVQVVEPIEGDWEVVASTLPATKRDARSFGLRVTVPARGETTVTFRVRVRWC